MHADQNLFNQISKRQIAKTAIFVLNTHNEEFCVIKIRYE